MATITGEMAEMLNQSFGFQNSVGSNVLALFDGKPIAQGTIDEFDKFSLEIPDDLRGEVEIQVGVHGAAPAIIDVDGSDLHVQIMYNPGGPLLA